MTKRHKPLIITDRADSRPPMTQVEADAFHTRQRTRVDFGAGWQQRGTCLCCEEQVWAKYGPLVGQQVSPLPEALFGAGAEELRNNCWRANIHTRNQPKG